MLHERKLKRYWNRNKKYWKRNKK